MRACVVICGSGARSDLLLGLLDAFSAVLVGYVAYRLRFDGLAVPASYSRHYVVTGGVLALGWPLVGRVGGLYTRRALRPGTSLVEPAFGSAVAVGAVLAVLNVLDLDGDLSRAWTGLVVLGLMVATLVVRGLVRRARRALVPLGIGLERYAVVGDGPSARRLHDDLTRAPGAPFTVVATLSAAAGPVGLAQQALDLRVDGLVLPGDVPPAVAGALAASLAASGVDVLLAPGVGGLETRVASVAMLHGVPLLRAAGMAPRRRAVRGRRGVRTLEHGVAILGTRGVPASYGGFETFAERLALHLVGAGVATTVYCRPAHSGTPSPWNGVRLVTVPTIATKYLDTVVHTFVSSLHLLLRTRCRDVVLCNAANAPVVALLRLFRVRVLLNVDGLEWRRTKWGVLGRSWYRMGEWLAVRLATVLVTDADEVRTYYRVRHDSDSVMIPYGSDLLERGAGQLPLPVEPDRYVLYVSRWEPENNPVMVAEAHAASGCALPLVMLGRATYDDDLEAAVRAAAAPTALLPGTVFGDGYRALQASALCYVQATEVGGTHPALIEALGAGNLCLVLDTPENREVAGPGGAWFFADAPSLAALVRRAAALPQDELDAARAVARTHAERTYSWTAVGDAYLDLLRDTPPVLHRTPVGADRSA